MNYHNGDAWIFHVPRAKVQFFYHDIKTYFYTYMIKVSVLPNAIISKWVWRKQN